MRYLKYVICLLCCITFAFVSGCGHNIVHVDRGTGMKLRIPTPDGGSLIDFAIGHIDSTTTVLRGGSNYASEAADGGSLTGTGGLTQRIQVSANPQVNEGNVVRILTDPACDPATKLAIAQYLASSKSPKPTEGTIKTVAAAASTGKSAPDVEPVKTTVEQAIDAVPKTLKAAGEPIRAVTEPAANAVNNTVNQSTETIEIAMSKIMWIVIVLGTVILIIGAYFLFRYIKYKRGKTNATTVTDIIAGISGKEQSSEATITEDGESKTTIEIQGGNCSSTYNSETPYE